MSSVIESHHDDHHHGPAKGLMDGFLQLTIRI